MAPAELQEISKIDSYSYCTRQRKQSGGYCPNLILKSNDHEKTPNLKKKEERVKRILKHFFETTKIIFTTKMMGL